MSQKAALQRKKLMHCKWLQTQQSNSEVAKAWVVLLHHRTKLHRTKLLQIKQISIMITKLIILIVFQLIYFNLICYFPHYKLPSKYQMDQLWCEVFSNVWSTWIQ
jgi:hypothetical protein